ncbi:unnamed protein product [Cyclocybe aegerita]|uniref:Nuclear condensin complex subunit 3 C-terminal domain-containing protein n=1 Tax=Cyclocybe aegerita TaxID=1973307 RepID=A0A8S0XXQ2_CYCAE|nr:unnamed protein product [Cyclocybe aegerita]
MPARTQTPQTPDETLVHASVGHVFGQAAASVANHRKNFVALHKIHMELATCKEVVNKKGNKVKLIGEGIFEKVFLQMFLKVVSLKKGEPSADRVLKFVGGYIKFINEKAAESQSPHDNNDDGNGNTTASRFTARLLKLLLKGFLSKDKNVRCRVLNSVAEMISHLGEIEEDIYTDLRDALIQRATDKETNVRYQAVVCLAKLCNPDELTDDENEDMMVSFLLERLAHDPSPDPRPSEVRRAILHNVPANQRTLPAILDRMKDTDATTRKAVYSAVLGKNMSSKTASDGSRVGTTHPKALTIAQRELVVRNGLGDRELSVRAAAGTLMWAWLDILNAEVEGLEGSDASLSAESLEQGLVSFLSLFDLAESTAAVDALLSVFTAKVEAFNNLEFKDHYWDKLIPEKAFLARVFVEHCKNTEDDVRLEAMLPVVTSVAFRIQESYNLHVEQEFLLSNPDIDETERNNIEDEKMARELVMSELLKLAVNLDYSDETGRRKMFQLVRDMLRRESLPENVMAPCLDVMRTLSPTERDLIRLVVETVQDLRDSVYGDAEEDEAVLANPDASFEESQPRAKPARKVVEDMSPEQRARVDRADLRCLSLCVGMLERVNSTFEENLILDGILRELIIPSVQRKDTVFRERGLKALGLCCLIAKQLATRSISLFMNQIPSSPINIRLTLVQSLFDIFMVHEDIVFKKQENNVEALTAFLLTHIETEQDPKVKATFCVGATKLVLSGIVTDVNVIKNLIKAYLCPVTADNQELRQCLSFFLPMYSQSSLANQKLMSDIFIHVFLDVCQDRKEAIGRDNTPPAVDSERVADMFLQWTDPLQVSHAIDATGSQAMKDEDECVQLDLAENILRTLFEKDLKVTIEKEDKQILCKLLNKLHIPDTVDDYRIRSLKLLMDNLRTRRPLRDTVSKNALAKFEATITRKFEKQFEQFSEEDFRKLHELNDLFQFLDSIIPLDDEEEFIDIDVPRKGKKRRSESVNSTTTEDSAANSLEKEKGRRASKRARPSTSEGDNDGEDDHSTGQHSHGPALPTRTLPKRAVAGKKPIQAIVISSDSDEDEGKLQARHKGKSRARFRPSVKTEEAQLDDEISALLSNSTRSPGVTETPFDSIMDDSEEEEDEVNESLLVQE